MGRAGRRRALRPRPSIPGPDVFDLRHCARNLRRSTKLAADRARVAGIREASLPHVRACCREEARLGLGSNNWAVAGAHTATGAALVANDMHLAINVPNIWYRASLVIPDARVPGQTLRITGVTLPGIPSVVVGSNGHVAWGFTNTGGDWSDLVMIEPDPRDATQYLTPDGPTADRAHHRDDRRAWARRDEPLDVEWTIWGPIVRTDARGRRLAQHWVAHDAERLAVGHHRARTGAHASTKCCASPRASASPRRTSSPETRRARSAGRSADRFRAAWASTDRARRPGRTARAGGTATSRAEEYPRIVNPASGRIWTANSPVVDRRRARRDRRRRLRRRHPLTHHPRSADGDRQGDAGRHAVGAARHQRALSRALAQARCWSC